MRKIIEKTIRKTIAVLLTVALVGLMSQAACIDANAADDSPPMSDPVGGYEPYVCTEEDRDKTIELSPYGRHLLEVPAGLSIAGVSCNFDAVEYNYNITNYGSIGTAQFAEGIGTVNMVGGVYGSITAPGSVVIKANGISANGINVSGVFSITGNNQVSTISANSISGEGNLLVRDSIQFSGTGTTATINVYPETQINNLGDTINVFCDGKAYAVNNGNTTLLSQYGVNLNIASTDDKLNWVIDGSAGENITSVGPVWFGNSSNKFTLTAKDGYYFPENYTVIHNGNGSVNLQYIDETTITFSYNVASDESSNVTITFPELKKLPVNGMGTFTVENIKYKEILKPQVTSSTNDTSSPLFEYKRFDESDEKYTELMPTAVGDYVARVTLPGNEEYRELVLETEFSILKAKGNAALGVSDIKFGETIVPQIVSDTNDVTSAIVEYKVAGAPDEAYTTTVPVNVGNYEARVILATNDSYEQAIATDSFSILKAEGRGNINVADIYYGGNFVPELSSDTNDVTSAIVEYKVAGTENSEYSSQIPTAVGEYTARVTFAENSSYNTVVRTDDFSISYLPEPEVKLTIDGVSGKNGFYVSTVVLNAPEGFLIADKLDGEYAKSITIKTSRKAGYFYYKNVITGEKTAGVWYDEIMIDAMMPTIDANEGAVYYAEFVEIKITDTNLSKITINGEEYTKPLDETILLKLGSNNGMELYEIVVTDLAGNTRTMKITVADNWMEDGLVPIGKNVNLITEYEYKFGAGEWMVEGDNTSYSGNTSFYVGSDGEYIFIQK